MNSAGKLFVFNQIVKNNSTLDNNYKTNKYTSESNTLGYNHKCLDYGFIQDEINNAMMKNISHVMTEVNHRQENSQESGFRDDHKVKVENEIEFKKINLKDEEKLQKISNKIDNIRNWNSKTIAQMNIK
jgi:hypothetical protein